MEGEGTPFRVEVNAASRYRRFATPSPSKPPSSSPNFPQPGFVPGTFELSVLRCETRCGRGARDKTRLRKVFGWIWAVRFYRKSGYRTCYVCDSRSFCPEGKNLLSVGLQALVGRWWTILSKTDVNCISHVSNNLPCHPERSGAGDKTTSTIAPNRRVVEPRRGASRRDLRTVEVVKPPLSKTDKKSIIYVSNSLPCHS